jgi:hypothetical protein
MAKHLLISAMAFLMAISTVFAQTVEERNAFKGGAGKESNVPQRFAQAGPAGFVSEIFPNPTASQGTFQVNLNAAGKIVFFNLLGTAVATQEFGKDAKLVNVDFSGFPEGVYFGIVFVGTKTVCTRRVTISR